jgi:probable HAF family extracellular repeat protein
MRDLGTLGGEHSRAQYINNKGQVVGSADTSEKRLGLATSHEFIWDSRHGMRDLNELIGCPEGEFVRVTGINDDGDIIGLMGGSKGFLFKAENHVEELKSIEALGEIEQLAINNNGEVAATVRMGGIEEGRRLSVILQPDGRLRQLPTPGGKWSWGQMYVLGMNDKGQVVCVAHNGHGGSGVFLRDSSGGLRDIKVPPLDPGLSIFLRGLKNPPRGEDAEAVGINNRGQIVGYYGPGEEPEDPQPEKPISELETFLGGPAKPYKSPLPLELFNAFIYDGSAVTDLNELIKPNFGWHIELACGINDRGQIIATAGKAWINNQGQWHFAAGEDSLTRKAALLLTPVLSAASSPKATAEAPAKSDKVATAKDDQLRSKQLVPTGWVKIVNRETGRVIHGDRDPLRIEQAGDCFKLRCKESGQFLAIRDWAKNRDDATNAKGQPLRLFRQVPASDDPSMLWEIRPVGNGFYTITNRASGKCLECRGRNQPVRQSPFRDAHSEQQWRIDAVP